MAKGIGGHTRPGRGATDIWLTPPELLRELGPFDLDPCAAPTPRPWATAATHYDATQGQDGLALPWAGLVWLNPPYSDPWPWLSKLAAHEPGGIALTFARTETDGFFRQGWEKAGGLFFLRGRLHFHYPDGTRAAGNAGGPSVLLGYSEEALKRLARCKLDGHLVVQAALLLRFADDGKPVGSWRAAVEAAMSGREMTLGALYKAAEGTAKVREAKAAGHNWRAQLRRTLQRHFEARGEAIWAPA